MVDFWWPAYQRYSSVHIFVCCVLCISLILWYALLETHISICLSWIFLDIIYTWLACSTNTVWFLCCECMYMLCQGLVCPRINVFEVNYLERLLAGPSSLCVSESRYWFLRCRINAPRNAAHSILVSTWYVPLAPLRFNTLKQASKLHLPLPLPLPPTLSLSLSLFIHPHTRIEQNIPRSLKPLVAAYTL